jgi:hypothetical protein
MTIFRGKLAFNVRYGGYDIKICHQNAIYATPNLTKKPIKRKRKHTLVPWIYTDKQILCEAIEEFLRHCTQITSCDFSTQPPTNKISLPL